VLRKITIISFVIKSFYSVNKIKLQSNHEDKKIITREKEKIEENQRLNDQEKILQKTALQHVNSLKDWEKTTLPKIGKV
jgi:hypothetical protein